jgi:hypothetical protein
MTDTALRVAHFNHEHANRFGTLSEDVARLEAMVDLLGDEASPRNRRALATFDAALSDRRRELLNSCRQDAVQAHLKSGEGALSG